MKSAEFHEIRQMSQGPMVLFLFYDLERHLQIPDPMGVAYQPIIAQLRPCLCGPGFARAFLGSLGFNN